MNRLRVDQIKAALSKHLSAGEALEAVGVFKKIPSTSWLFLTRGMAWLLTQEFHVGVTDQRIVILPVPKKCKVSDEYEGVIYADFDEVNLYEGPIKNTMLDIHKMYKGKPLHLRYKSNLVPEGLDLYEFITAIKQKMV